MQRRALARAALSLAVGLLVVLGIILIPASTNGAGGDDAPAGRAERAVHLTHGHVIARPSHPAQPTPGRSVAVPPITGTIPAALADHVDPDRFCGTCRAAGRSTWAVRAPPVSAA